MSNNKIKKQNLPLAIFAWLMLFIAYLSISVNPLFVLVLFSSLGIFLIIKNRKTNKLGVFFGVMFLSPVLSLILFIAFILTFPVFSYNAWALLTYNGWEIPKESSIFTFRDTLNNYELGGNGEYWHCGEDDKYYYAKSKYDPVRDVDYIVFKKGNEPPGFDGCDTRTWGLEDAKEE